MAINDYNRTVLESSISDMLGQEKRLRPADILERLIGQKHGETEARKAISEMIDRNELVFDHDWFLTLNPSLIRA